MDWRLHCKMLKDKKYMKSRPSLYIFISAPIYADPFFLHQKAAIKCPYDIVTHRTSSMGINPLSKLDEPLHSLFLSFHITPELPMNHQCWDRWCPIRINIATPSCPHGSAVPAWLYFSTDDLKSSCCCSSSCSSVNPLLSILLVFFSLVCNPRHAIPANMLAYPQFSRRAEFKRRKNTGTYL